MSVSAAGATDPLRALAVAWRAPRRHCAPRPQQLLRLPARRPRRCATRCWGRAAPWTTTRKCDRVERARRPGAWLPLVQGRHRDGCVARPLSRQQPVFVSPFADSVGACWSGWRAEPAGEPHPALRSSLSWQAVPSGLQLGAACHSHLAAQPAGAVPLAQGRHRDGCVNFCLNLLVPVSSRLTPMCICTSAPPPSPHLPPPAGLQTCCVGRVKGATCSCTPSPPARAQPAGRLQPGVPCGLCTGCAAAPCRAHLLVAAGESWGLCGRRCSAPIAHAVGCHVSACAGPPLAQHCAC